ncbi:hypothetical protein [Bifidobacterium breve]|uniref:hypothetical protein n=1 Tax=Bifidobacterium breve TaxID=1685 RepID=UPI0021B0F237|nr:hypothetical protein [Bifidobacterium breve]
MPPSLGSQSHSDLLVGGQQFGLAKAQHLIELGERAGAGGPLYGNAPIQWFYPLFMLAMPAAWLLYAATANYVHGRTR